MDVARDQHYTLITLSPLPPNIPFTYPHSNHNNDMQSTTLSSLTLLTILFFCGCSNHGDTAQYPEMAPPIEHAKRLTKAPVPKTVEDLTKEPEKEIQPADVMLQEKVLLGSLNQEFSGDSFLETQASFEEMDTGVFPTADQTDFSQGIILDTE